MTTATLELEPPAATDAPGEAAPSMTYTSGMAGLLSFTAGARTRFLLSGALAAASALLSLVPYWAIYRTLEGLVDGDVGRADLWRYAAIAAISIIVRFTVLGISTSISHTAAYRLLYGIRVGIAEHLARVPLGYVTSRRSGQIKKVMGEDVERLELFLAHGIPDLVAAAVTLVAVPAWLFAVDWRMGAAAVVVLLPAAGCMALGMRRSASFMPEYHRTLGDMNASVVELVRGMPVVKVFNRGTDRVRDAERAVERHVEVVKAYSRAFLPFGTAFYVVLGANVALLVPLGIWLHDRASLSTEDLLFFLVLGLGALAPVVSLLHLFFQLSHLTTGGNLVRELLEAGALDDTRADQRPLDSSVELRGVEFGYGERRVLQDVSFRAEPGTMTALVGPSGAGKSTIAALIARFWDVDDGAVLVGGVDVRRIAPDDLGRHVAVVLQDTFLFDDTVAANLRVARPSATDAEVHAAARAARADEFVTALPYGYDTQVGERGAHLSGGERQRLALARAILADAPVIVLDEATSFADPENEALIQEAIGELVAGKTLIVVAHRLSSVAGADQILVVEGGRITERGGHDALVELDGTYARLWDDFVAAESIALGDAVRRRAR